MWRISLRGVTADWLLHLFTSRYLWELPRIWRYGLAVLLVAAATLARWVIVPWIGTDLPYGIAAPSLVLTTLLLGIGPGLLFVLLNPIAILIFIMGSSYPRGAAVAVLGIGWGAGTMMCGMIYAVHAAEIKVRESQARLSSFAAATFEGVVESRAGRIVDCNEQFAQMLGRTVAELKGAAIVELVAPEDRERVLMNVLDNRGMSIEHSMLHKTGLRIVVEAHGQPMSPDAATRHLAVQNITARKEMEEALRLSEQRFRLMGETVPFGVWMTDTRGEIVYLSRQLLELFGLTMEEVRRAGWMTRITREDARVAKRHWMHCVRTGKDWEYEFRILGANGAQYTILSRGKPVRDSRSHIVAWAGVNLDVTDRKLTEQALIRSERLASVACIAMTMAHEINNPLMAVINATFLALSHPELPESVRRYLEIADAELRRVEHVTQQTFGFYSASTARACISLSDLLDSLSDSLKDKLQDKHVTLDRQYKDRPHVMGISGELRQVFSALLTNSLAAVDEYGTIKVRISYSGIARHGTRYVRVTVADNGKGIAATALPHIFEAFYTTTESVKTGLGLWVSKQIVEKHVGAIRVHSSTTGRHRGTSVSIALPAELTAVTARAASRPAP